MADSSRLQFRLSHLLTLIILAAVLLGWWVDRRRLRTIADTAEDHKAAAEVRYERTRAEMIMQQQAHDAQLAAYKRLDEVHQQRLAETAHLQGTWLHLDGNGRLEFFDNGFQAENAHEFPAGIWIVKLGANGDEKFLQLVREHADGFTETQCYRYRIEEERLDVRWNAKDRQRYPVNFDVEDDATVTMSFKRETDAK